MEEQQRNIDEAFRESLGGYREEPPAAAWEAVRRRLDVDKGRRRRFFAWWAWVSMLLLLIGGTWLVAEQFGMEKDVTENRASSSARPIPQASPSNGGQPVATQMDKKMAESSGDTNATDVTKTEEDIAAKAQGSLSTINEPDAPQAAAPRQPRRAQVAGARRSTTRATYASGGAPTASSRRTSRVELTTNTLPNAGDSASEQQTQRRMRHAQPYVATAATVDSRTKTPTSVSPAAPSRTRVVTPTTKPRARRAEEKPVAGKRTDTSSTQPVSSAMKILSVAADSSDAKNSTLRTRRDKARRSVPPSVVANARRKAAPTVDVGVAATNPKTKSVTTKADTATVAVKSTVTKTTDVSTPTARNAATSGNAKPVTQTKGAAANIAAAASTTTTTNNATTANSASTPQDTAATSNRGAAGIPVMPNSALPVVDTPEAPSASATTSGTGGGGGQVDDEDEEGKDTVANPSRKKPFPLSITPLAGYEVGMLGAAPNRFTGSLRILWHPGRNWSVGVQPAYRSSTVGNVTLQEPGTFQRSSPIDVDSFFVPDMNGTIFGTGYYYISQDFDSIVTPGRTVGGKLWEVELPLMVRYTVPRTGLYVYGGPTLVFGGRLTSTTTGTVQTFQAQRRDSIILRGQLPPTMGGGGLPADTFTNYFGTSSLPPFSSYDSTGTALIQPSATRYGYMFGVGYDWRRIVLDVSIHRQLTGYSDVNAGLRDVYASPYVRMSLGYRIGGARTERRKRARNTDEKKFLQRL